MRFDRLLRVPTEAEWQRAPKLNRDAETPALPSCPGVQPLLSFRGLPPATQGLWLLQEGPFHTHSSATHPLSEPHPFFLITTDFLTAGLEYPSNPEPPLDLVCFPHGLQEVYEHLRNRHFKLGDPELSEGPCHWGFAHTTPFVWCLFP